MRLILSLVVALPLLIAVPLPSQAQDAEPAATLVVHVTSDDAWSGLKGLKFA